MDDLVIPQTGGRLLGQGAYGCIFNPPLQCRQRGKSTQRPGKLGKLTEKIDIKHEIEAANYFRKIPGSDRYFILPEPATLCNPAPLRTQKEEELANCKVLQKMGVDDMLHYEVEHGGKTLGERVKEAFGPISVEYGACESESAINPLVRARLQQASLLNRIPFWSMMEQLLEIGAFLVLHGYVHNDLHGKNIMMNADAKIRLIDFGRAYHYSSIGKELIHDMAGMFDAYLGQIPPEGSCQDGIEEGIPFPQVLNALRTQKPAILCAEKLLGVSRTQQMAEFKTFWETSRAAQKGDWVAFWKLYWTVVDSWAIGHQILSLLRKLSLSRKFTESMEWKRRGALVKTILRGLLRTSPRERLDCVEALAMFDPMNDLVTGELGRAWLERKAAIRARQRGST